VAIHRIVGLRVGVADPLVQVAADLDGPVSRGLRPEFLRNPHRACFARRYAIPDVFDFASMGPMSSWRRRPRSSTPPALPTTDREVVRSDWSSPIRWVISRMPAFGDHRIGPRRDPQRIGGNA
jgi:hypothetical protein